jgi:hypothetical protein
MKMNNILWKFLGVTLLVSLPGTSALAQSTEPPKARHLENFAQIPLAFTENLGQYDPQVKFSSRVNGVQYFFTATGFTSLLSRETEASVNKRQQTALNSGAETAQAGPFLHPLPEYEHYAVKFEFLNARGNPQVVGEERLSWNNHYFKGNDPAAWRTNVPNYEKIRVKNIYDGVDLLYYGSEGQVEYDLIVAPFTDPQQIVIACQGADSLEITSQGELEIQTPLGAMTHSRPTVYQMVDGSRQEITAGYTIVSESQLRAKNPTSTESLAFTFEIGDYDPSKPLRIDPVLRYSRCLRGSSNERAFGITVNTSGAAYITGFTDSQNFPRLPGPQNSEGVGGDLDIFVVKLNSAGNALEFATFIGGSREDVGRSIALGPFDRIYVAGGTNSADFPTEAAFDATLDAGAFDACVLFLSPAGDQLFYSTYLGGLPGLSGGPLVGRAFVGSQAFAIAVDTNGAFYVTGATNSQGFPTTPNAFDRTHPGNVGGGGLPVTTPYDVFLTKFTPTGTALEYSTYIGGVGEEVAFGIVVDGSGAAYISGWTGQGAFTVDDTIRYPMTNNVGWQPGGQNTFATKMNPDGSALDYSFLLASMNRQSVGTDIAIDAAGAAYVAGFTDGTIPTTAGAFDTTFARANGSTLDAFVFKLTPDGSSPVYSTLLGGASNDLAYGIDVDDDGNAYVTGWTTSADFPLAGANLLSRAAPFQRDIFVTRLNPTGTGIDFSSFLGDIFDDEQGFGTPVFFRDQALYVTGYTRTPSLLLGGDEAFAAKIDVSDLATPMSYISSTTTQSSLLPLLKNTVDQKIIGIQIETAGGQNPLTVTQFSLSTNGSTNPGTDIRNAKIYYTRGSPTFNTNQPFGATVPNPAGAFSITGSQRLTQGTNYFWLTYDIPSTATANNLVDGECLAIVIDGVTQTPTVTAPAGAGTIVIQRPGLAGVGTIGPGGDFANFTSAMEALAERGISGPLVLNVMPGFYYEQIVIANFGSSSGTSLNQQSSNRQGSTLTIQSATGNPRDVILAFDADAAQNYVVFIANTEDSIVIKDMTIQAFGEQSGRVVLLEFANKVSLINNILESLETDPVDPSSHALIFTPEFGFYLEANIRGNTFKNGSTGVHMLNIEGGDLKILDNRFDNQSRFGINVSPPAPGIASIWINENALTTNSTNGTYAGITLANCQNLQEIQKNRIAVTIGTGMSLARCQGPNPTGALIANNFVQGGVMLFTSDFLNLYHNSVHASHLNGIFPADALTLNLPATTANVRIVNNIFSNSVDSKAYFFLTPTVPAIVLDYNDLYTTGPLLVSTGSGAGYADLAAWQGFSGLDANSVSVAPEFVSDSDLHTAAAGIADRGMSLAEVTDDIDGEARDPATPDIGADEDVAITQQAAAMDEDIYFVTSSGDTVGTMNFSNLGTVTSITLRVYPNSSPPNFPANNRVVQRYYDLRTDGSGFNAQLSLYYKDAEVMAGGLMNYESNLQLYRYDGSEWALQGGTVDTERNTVTLENVTRLSLWAISEPEMPTSVAVDQNVGVPKTYRLAQNYPNPFNPSTSIEFELPIRHGQGMVQLEVFNLLGQRVRSLLHEVMPPGVYKVVWDGQNDHGALVASGIYIYGIRTDKFTAFKKMTVIK